MKHICVRFWRFIPKNVDHCFLTIFLVFCTVYPITYLYIPWLYVTKDDVPNDLYLCNYSAVPEQQLCPLFPEELRSYARISRSVDESLLATMAENLQIDPGGKWRPSHCAARQNVAVVVPYRNRPVQLQIFLQNMHPFLQKQSISYRLFIIEQTAEHDFNRGKLFNIGLKEALKLEDFCCFIFHDVDLLPLSEQHIYYCSHNPRHMCATLDKFRFRLQYEELFGGAIAIPRRTFEAVNGFSNEFFGWGGEDDDFSRRLKKKGISITRWEPNISRYTMLTHRSEVPNPNRFQLLQKRTESDDGLSSLQYKVVRMELKPLCTWVLVNIRP